MTHALRRRHRTAILVLAIAVPAGIALALAVRPVLPPVSSVLPLDGPAKDLGDEDVLR
jgi:hypothetical protein